MSKIAIVTDSNSGITQSQAKELGIHVLPMPFMIDGETFYEEITLSQEAFYQKLAQNADIATSQPSPESIMQLWDELLKEHDEIVHIPMSSGLSGSCQTAVMLAQDYDGKVSDNKIGTIKANPGTYTATFKPIKSGTTTISVTSKITKKVIARYDIKVKAIGNGDGFGGDYELTGDDYFGNILAVGEPFYEDM